MQTIALWQDNVPLFDPKVADQAAPTITPYLMDKGVRGAVIICPGGGYMMKAAHEGAPIAQWINQCGVHAFVLDYRVSPYRHPAMLLDLQRAIRTVRFHAKEWGIDPDHIAVMGFSAGGHLATMAATHFDAGDPTGSDPIERVSCRPDAFIPCYAVTSFFCFTHTGSMQNMTGKQNLTPGEAKFFSAEYNVTAETPPAFLWHTAQDGGVPVENSMRLAQALFDRGIPCSLHVFPFGNHGIGLGQDNALAKAWPDLLNAWLVEIGF